MVKMMCYCKREGIIKVEMTAMGYGLQSCPIENLTRVFCDDCFQRFGKEAGLIKIVVRVQNKIAVEVRKQVEAKIEVKKVLK